MEALWVLLETFNVVSCVLIGLIIIIYLLFIIIFCCLFLCTEVDI